MVATPPLSPSPPAWLPPHPEPPLPRLRSPRSRLSPCRFLFRCRSSSASFGVGQSTGSGASSRLGQSVHKGRSRGVSHLPREGSIFSAGPGRSHGEVFGAHQRQYLRREEGGGRCRHRLRQLCRELYPRDRRRELDAALDKAPRVVTPGRRHQAGAPEARGAR